MKRIPRAVALLIILLLPACGASKISDSYRGRSLALIIVEEWQPKVEDSAKTFAAIVENDAENFGMGGGIVVGLAGCIAVGAYVAQGSGQAGCVVGALAGAAAGYLVGYGIGAVIGAIEGSIAAIQDDYSNVDAGPLVAAFEASDASAELEAALRQKVRLGPDTSLDWIESARPAEDYGHLAKQGYPFVIVLRITKFYVGIYYDVVSPASRVHLSVEGEVINTATNGRILERHWSHTGESVDPSRLAENKSELLRSQMKKAWAGISSKIAEDVFS